MGHRTAHAKVIRARPEKAGDVDNALGHSYSCWNPLRWVNAIIYKSVHSPGASMGWACGLKKRMEMTPEPRGKGVKVLFEKRPQHQGRKCFFLEAPAG